MIEGLPIRVLTDEDAPVFGTLPVALAKLYRTGFPVAQGLVVTAPHLKLKTTLEHYDFGVREVFTQSLELVKKEIQKIPVPEKLGSETGKHNDFLVRGEKVKSAKPLWQKLLLLWLDEIKTRLWNRGFYTGITEGLTAHIVIFANQPQAQGSAYYDEFTESPRVLVKSGKLNPDDFERICELVESADKKLFLPHEYEWIVDRGVKLSGIMPAPHPAVSLSLPALAQKPVEQKEKRQKSAVKVFFDFSAGFAVEKGVDGVYIASEKIFDLNKSQSSFDDMVLKLVESAVTYPASPVLFKLADKSEGMGKVRGTLRLLHQRSLLDPMITALDFARHKKNLINVHAVIPFVRSVNELLQIKRELAVRKLMRKNSLEMWLEMAVPENIINVEQYLIAGIDGVVLNLDELISHLNGFDPAEAEMAFYKNEVDGLLKFLEDGIRLMHKSKTPFITYGSLIMYPKVLEFLVEKGVFAVVAGRYEAHSAYELLHQTEKRIILRRA